MRWPIYVFTLIIMLDNIQNKYFNNKLGVKLWRVWPKSPLPFRICATGTISDLDPDGVKHPATWRTLRSVSPSSFHHSKTHPWTDKILFLLITITRLSSGVLFFLPVKRSCCGDEEGKRKLLFMLVWVVRDTDLDNELCEAKGRALENPLLF